MHPSTAPVTNSWPFWLKADVLTATGLIVRNLWEVKSAISSHKRIAHGPTSMLIVFRSHKLSRPNLGAFESKLPPAAALRRPAPDDTKRSPHGLHVKLTILGYKDLMNIHKKRRKIPGVCTLCGNFFYCPLLFSVKQTNGSAFVSQQQLISKHKTEISKAEEHSPNAADACCTTQVKATWLCW